MFETRHRPRRLRDGSQNVEALLNRVRFYRDCPEWVHPARVGAVLVIRCPTDAWRAVDDHHARYPFGMLCCEHEPGHRGEPEPEDGRLLAPGRIHHRDRVLGPELWADLVERGPRGQPIPRWSNRITLANDASRRWKRYSPGSASIESNGMNGPGSTTRSPGPSPKTWSAMSMSPHRG